MHGCSALLTTGVSSLRRQIKVLPIGRTVRDIVRHHRPQLRQATFLRFGRLPFEKLDRAQNDDYDIREGRPQTRAAAAVPGRGRVSLFSHHYARSTNARFNPVWLI
jgi:hypothetical protein